MNVCNAFSRLIVGAIVGSLMCQRVRAAEEWPSCGVLSVYGILKLHGKNVSLDEVCDHIESLGPSAKDEMSVLQMRDSIREFGLPAEIVRSDLANPSAIECPSIIYLGQGAGTRSGHVVLLRYVDQQRAVLQDLSESGELADIAFADLHKQWTGELVLVSRTPAASFRWNAVCIAVALCAAIGAGIIAVRTGRRPKSRKEALCWLIFLTAASVCSGCSRGEGSATGPLVTAHAMVDFGTVEQDDTLSHVFEIMPVGDSAVRVTRVDISCGCVSSEPDIAGKRIAPGSTYPFKLVLHTRDYAGRIEGKALIFSDASPERPLAIGLRATVQARPVVATPRRAVVFGVLDQVPLEISVTYRRHAGLPALELDSEKSSIARCRIIQATRSSAVRAPSGASVDDEIVDHLRILAEVPPGLRVGRYALRAKLKWRELCEPTEADIDYEVLHPAVPQASEVHLGILEPGDLKAVDLPIAFRRPDVKLACATCNLDFISVARTPAGNLHIEATPRSAGRIDGTLEVAFEPLDVEPISIPIRGIVRSLAK